METPINVPISSDDVLAFPKISTTKIINGTIINTNDDEIICQKTDLTATFSLLTVSFIMGLVFIGIAIFSFGEVIVCWIKEIEDAKKSQKP